MTELAEPSSDLAIPSPLRVPVFVNSSMAAVHREPSVGLGSVLFAVWLSRKVAVVLSRLRAPQRMLASSFICLQAISATSFP